MPTPKLRFKDENGQEFPEWIKVPFTSIADVRDGTHDSPKYHKYGFPLITSKNLSSSGKIDFSNVNFISENDYLNINKRSKVDIGDIIFGLIGTIGRPAIVQQEGFAIKNVALIKPNVDLVNNKFLYQLISSDSFNKLLEFLRSGGNQKFVSLGLLREMNFYLPELEEQHKIAEFLSTVDEKVEALETKLEALNSLKKGFMQKIFSQELRFKDDSGCNFNEPWIGKKLNELVSFKKGKILSKSHLSDNGVPCVLYGQLYTSYKEVISTVISKTDYNSKGLVYSSGGEVLMPCSGETAEDISRASYLPLSGVALGGDLHILYPSKEISGNILSYILNTVCKRHIARIAQGKTVVHTSSDSLGKIEIFFPKNLEEQRKIAEFLSAFDEKIEAVKRQVEAMKQVKKGLLQQMFV